MTSTVREAPHHRNLTCYSEYRCRLPECVDRYNTWQRNRLRAMADGTWQPFVDATRVREHLLNLHAVGITPHRVALITGLDWNTVRRYTQPDLKHRQGMIRRTTHEIEAKILAIQPEPTMPGLVDPTGTRRRIQALSAIGWPLKELGPHINIKPDNVRRLLKDRQRHVQGTTARAVIDAYELLRNSNPRRHGISKIGYDRARRNAKTHRWAPPKYWDQHPGAIDDPHFEPMYGLTRREIIAQDASELMRAGLDKQAAAEHLGVHPTYIEHAFRDHPQYAVEVAA